MQSISYTKWWTWFRHRTISLPCMFIRNGRVCCSCCSCEYMPPWTRLALVRSFTWVLIIKSLSYRFDSIIFGSHSARMDANRKVLIHGILAFFCTHMHTNPPLPFLSQTYPIDSLGSAYIINGSWDLYLNFCIHSTDEFSFLFLH